MKKLRINSSGEVSIGTASGGKTLTLYGASSSSFRISKSGVLAYDHTFDGSTYTIANNNGSAGIPIVIGTKTGGGESLRIDASGRLLINGASANNAFSGGDDLIIGNSSGSTRSGITIVSNSSQDGGLYFSDGTSSGNAHVQGQIVYEHDGNYLRLYTAASRKTSHLIRWASKYWK